MLTPATASPNDGSGAEGEAEQWTELADPTSREAVVVRRENYGSRRSLLEHIEMAEMNKQFRLWCCPKGIGKHSSIPLFLVVTAFALTFCGCFVCFYFKGATTGFTGSHANYAGSRYGLWPFEDINGKCVPWDVLFYHKHLDSYFRAARAIGMTALMLRWSLMTLISQTLQCYLVSWVVSVGLFLWLVATFPTEQLWTDAALLGSLLNIVLIVIVRAFLCHRVRRKISRRGSKCIASFLTLCSVLCVTTLLALKSDFCQCKHLTVVKHEGKLDPRQDPCEDNCNLGPAAVTMIFASTAWIIAGLAVFKFGLQPDDDGSETDALEGSGPLKSPCSVEDMPDSDPNTDEGGNKDEEECSESREVEDDEFHRTCCQRICCDVRVRKRSWSEKAVFCIFRVCLVVIFAMFVFSVVNMVGSRLEQNAAERSPSTASSFITNMTCAFNASYPSAPFFTYNTPEEARADNMTVAHCGQCGYCSNMDDIETYVKTRKTITKSTKRCGPKGLFGSREDVDKCLKKRVGMSDECSSGGKHQVHCEALSFHLFEDTSYRNDARKHSVGDRRRIKAELVSPMR
jgi:hypothetical protein